MHNMLYVHGSAAFVTKLAVLTPRLLAQGKANQGITNGVPILVAFIRKARVLTAYFRRRSEGN